MKPRLTQSLFLMIFILMLVTGPAAYAAPHTGGAQPTTSSAPANQAEPDKLIPIEYIGSERDVPGPAAQRSASESISESASSTETEVESALTIEPQSLDFGNALVGQFGAPRRSTLTNVGDAPLTIVGIYLGSATLNSYAVAGDTCSSTQPLASGASCYYNVVVAPGAPGESQASLVVVTDDPVTSAFDIQTRVFGTTPTTAEVEAAALDFGQVELAAPIVWRFVTVSNTGASLLGLSHVVIEGEYAAAFSLNGLNACLHLIAINDSCTFRAGFAPQQGGPASATLVIHSNAAGSPWSIPLNGTGIQAAVTLSQPTLAFGPRIVNTTTNPRSLTLSNSGAAPLSINTLVVVGVNAGDFVLANATTCIVGTLAPQASCTIAVTFRPSARGTRNAALRIDSNAPESPRIITLSGTGISAASAVNLLRNPGFEQDVDNNDWPDGWSTNVRVTRSDLLKHSGTFAMRHASTSDATFTQTSMPMYGLQGGMPYAFSGWVNIPVPPSADPNGFSFSVEVQWRNDLDAVIRTTSLRTHTASTNGWVKTAMHLVAPDGTSSAIVRLVATSLIGPVYIDDVFLGNLVANSGFERDTNEDTRPDNWTTNSNIDRATSVQHNGAYAMRHSLTTASSYTVVQVVPNITPGAAYTFAGCVNIPAGFGTFTSFSVVLEWRNGSTRLGTLVLVKSYTAATTGWDRATRQLVAPAGANNVVVRLMANNLSRPVYVDDIYLHP